MERKKASDFDPQLLGLFNKYVHGAINRREFLDGAAKFAIGSMTAMSLWEMLRPNYAWAQQVPKDDKRIKAEYTFTRRQGQRSGWQDARSPGPAGERHKFP
jgi:carboxymethylenebutenolidase